MSQLTDSLRATAQSTELQLDALDRALTENEAALTTAQLQSRKMDVQLAELRAQIASALARA